MNSFGRIFRISIFGESHGSHVGVCIDGVPPGIELSVADFKTDINRRKPAQKGTTDRKESDVPILISGVYHNRTSGSPICIIFNNEQQKSEDYSHLTKHFRPGHADFTAYIKYKGYNDFRGGGHFSGRLTLPLVAAGVVAKKIIHPINVSAYVTEIGGQKNLDKAINHALNENDSIGGIVECKTTSVPAGLGEPFFDSLESLIAHAMFAIPGIKGIEFGSGFKLARMKGSIANDVFMDASGKTQTNHHGGILGGISSGNDIIFRVAVKPPSSIGRPQQTYNWTNGQIEELQIGGRHDACIALRIPVVVEALTACVLADSWLIQKTFDS